MRTLLTMLLCSTLITTAACRGRPEKSSPPGTVGLKTVIGDGFTLSVPLEARVEHVTDREGTKQLKISPPPLRITAAVGAVGHNPADTADTAATAFTRDEPLYTLYVVEHRKSKEQTLKAWCDSVMARENKDSQADWDQARGGPVVIAGLNGYEIDFFCGDCGPSHFYVARGSKVIELYYSTDSNEPLAVRKLGIYALLISTFRWR